MVSGCVLAFSQPGGILHRERYGKGACHRVLVRGILRKRMRAAVAKVPFVILYDACIGGNGIGIQGGDISQAYQAVVVKINAGFGGDGYILLQRYRHIRRHSG